MKVMLLKGYSLALVSIVLGALGQVILKSGADKIGSLSLSASSLFSDLLRIIKTPQILSGMVFFGLSSLLWIKVLTRSELSLVYPMVSLSYILVAILSFLLFKEQFTMQKILGIAVIITGVVVLNS